MFKLLRPLARRAPQRILASAARPALRPATIQAMKFSGDTWKDRGHAAEDLWFTQHEAEMMQTMLNKIKNQHEALYGEHGKTKAREALIGIFEKHGVQLSVELADDLRKWRIEFTE